MRESNTYFLTTSPSPWTIPQTCRVVQELGDVVGKYLFTSITYKPEINSELKIINPLN